MLKVWGIVEADLPVHIFVALKDFAATDCKFRCPKSSSHQRSSYHANEQRKRLWLKKNNLRIKKVLKFHLISFHIYIKKKTPGAASKFNLLFIGPLLTLPGKFIKIYSCHTAKTTILHRLSNIVWLSETLSEPWWNHARSTKQQLSKTNQMVRPK